jgi:hypothetical protein
LIYPSPQPNKPIKNPQLEAPKTLSLQDAPVDVPARACDAIEAKNPLNGKAGS